MTRSARTLSIVGEILCTVGVVILLYAVYQLWWTNVEANRAAEQATNDIRATWETQSSGTTASKIAVTPDKPFGLMYIPRLRDHVWQEPLIEGVEKPQLAKGIGHYIGTALPGAIGNFATAGHRSTHGEPLAHIDELQKGDLVFVETAVAYYTYKLTSTKIVQPTDTWVIDPVPGKPNAKPNKAIITLTTCHPRWGNTERWIWWGDLIATMSKDSGKRPAELKGT